MAPREGEKIGCHRCGCGYPSPLEAMKNGPREEILYITCIRPPKHPATDDKPDCLAVVDVDPKSDTYCKIIHRVEMKYPGDELHHFGWNACSSCFGKEGVSRSHLAVMSLLSSRVYIVDVSNDIRKPTLHKVIEPEEFIGKTGNCNPHTAHCLPSKQIMMSTLGDENGNAKGSFVLIDSDTFDVIGKWESSDESLPFGYSFWYQPYHNVMISSEWGAPKALAQGFQPQHVKEGLYGRSIHIWNWKERTVKQTIDLGPDGMLPFEVRFLHNPKEAQAYVGCALSSTMFRVFKKEDGEWEAENVFTVEPRKVSGWLLPEMPGLLTDHLISLDDKYLYVSLYLHGDIRQYDISDRRNPKLVGHLFLGGSFHKATSVYLLDEEGRPDPVLVQGTMILGGPHKLQLSLDGKRLYVTNSLFSRWDQEFYPELVKKGSTCVKIDVDTDKGGLTLDDNFLVDFGEDPNEPLLAHEMRYPGGDCTSDVWLATDDRNE